MIRLLPSAIDGTPPVIVGARWQTGKARTKGKSQARLIDRTSSVMERHTTQPNHPAADFWDDRRSILSIISILSLLAAGDKRLVEPRLPFRVLSVEPAAFQPLQTTPAWESFGESEVIYYPVFPCLLNLDAHRDGIGCGPSPSIRANFTLQERSPLVSFCGICPGFQAAPTFAISRNSLDLAAMAPN